MSTHARIKISRSAIYVRFENVGKRDVFNAIMDRFNESFPLKQWEEKQRSWQLPTSNLKALKRFCTALFGANGFVIERQNITPPEFGQLPLHFID